MKRILSNWLALSVLLVTSCGPDTQSPTRGLAAAVASAKSLEASSPAPTLAQARQGFATHLQPRQGEGAPGPAPTPPAKLLQVVHYAAPAGPLVAYLTPDPHDGHKHPAIVWLTGGDSNTLGDVWTPAPPDNDQTASAYRQAGIAMLFPSLRGGNDNPGQKEGFLGEVDDVLAARDFLARQPWVDPRRIYLGGHSTGGTLALLVAEVAPADRFRAVVSFGPVADVSGYPTELLPFDTTNPREIALRSPGLWLASIAVPTFVLEGTRPPGNLAALQAMARASTNPRVHFHPIPGADHFATLAPLNRLIAGKIMRDTGSLGGLAFAPGELDHLPAP